MIGFWVVCRFDYLLVGLVGVLVGVVGLFRCLLIDCLSCLILGLMVLCVLVSSFFCRVFCMLFVSCMYLV